MRGAFAIVTALAFASVAVGTVIDPSHPAPGQYYRDVMAPRGSLISLSPPDGAEFLVGQLFDIRLESHALSDNFPSLTDLQFTIAGDKPLNQLVLPSTYTDPKVENWNFTYIPDAAAKYAKNTTLVKVSSLAWRSVALPKAGTYSVYISTGGQVLSAVWTIRSFEARKAKNAVLFIADGMSIGASSAARVISKQTKFGKYGKNFLSFQQMGPIGLVATNGLDSIMTDSANSAHAYSTGQKSAVNALGVYPDTSASSLDDPKVETLPEYIRRLNPNRCIGIVTTAEVQDATPAAWWAHTRRRGDKAIITDQAIYGVANFSTPVRPDVLFGGGGEFFCNTTNSSFCASNKKQNYYDLYKKLGYTVVNSKDEMKSFSGAGPVVGIFALNNMESWIERNLPEGQAGFNAVNAEPNGKGGPSAAQPNLDEMVAKAIEVMEKKCGHNGFFLMAEAATIDKMMHPIDFDRALADTLELDRAVEVVLNYNKKTDGSTFVMLTSDHAQAYDFFGTVDTKYFNSQPVNATGDDPLYVRKRRAIGEYQLAGFPDLVVNVSTGIPSLWNGRFKIADGKVDSPEHTEDWQLNAVDPKLNPASRPVGIINANYTVKGDPVAVKNPKNDPDGVYMSPNSAVSDTSTVHSGADVPLYCSGPAEMAIKCSKMMDNTEVFFLLAEALGLGSGKTLNKRDVNIEQALAPEFQYDVPARRAGIGAHHPGEL